ncbi:uncharacterized protein EV420DRAFT_1696443 [Desarmillaria tabescens]|uniref:DUF1445-domain-containing protein n=1 Tax=Armillaria tabescens TaxID=1929756 RepID=A0AA39N1J3_ARMTA|nr:uncharacterized protein EV420DRAFT_1696443 [Desarmillaria tabescens]KAK0453994.1 hypothetical protein EV420DRAFT_1696443 [Desarmillaria tabescens]
MSVSQVRSPYDVRILCRNKAFNAPSTAGLCPGYSQANVIILPNKFAADFRCPLLGETKPGDPQVPEALAADSDVRTDCPSYNVYRDGVFSEQKESIEQEWRNDSVTFFIGCSYSFEAALAKNGLAPRHLELGRAVPMYRTSYRLCPAGVFSGHMVVSMRPYRLADLERVRDITRPFVKTHGEPVAWGPEGAKSLGITDLDGTNPDFGDPTVIKDGEIAVYFGCGVTPQLSVMDSGIAGEVVGHTPGRMLMLDIKDEDVCVSV